MGAIDALHPKDALVMDVGEGRASRAMGKYVVSLDREGRIPIRTVVVPEPAERAASVGYGRFDHVFGALQRHCPAHVDVGRWQQCLDDGHHFLWVWGGQAEALGWTAADLFKLHPVPSAPHPTYSRLSRYDCTGLIWLLQGRRVVALTESAAAIRNPTGNITVYRRLNREDFK
jgi:hypothetical protein